MRCWFNQACVSPSHAVKVDVVKLGRPLHKATGLSYDSIGCSALLISRLIVLAYVLIEALGARRRLELGCLCRAGLA